MPLWIRLPDWRRILASSTRNGSSSFVLEGWALPLLCACLRCLRLAKMEIVDVVSFKDTEGVKETDSQKSCGSFDLALLLKRKLQALERQSDTSHTDPSA
ncbi:unnamed protein product [Prunus brigantina]